MADVTAQRVAMAETRARIDARLDELVDHVPDRQDVQKTVIKYGAAAAGVVVGIAALVIGTKSSLHSRRSRSEAKSYAKAVLRAMPGVAEAFLAETAVDDEQRGAAAHQADRKTQERVAAITSAASDLRDAAAAAADAKAAARAEVKAAAKVVRDAGTPRGGVSSAVLMAVGVIGGVAVAQALGANRPGPG